MTSNKVFYEELSQLRDLFHKYGRFDDSNAKLDEISKYISIYVYQLKNKTHNALALKQLISQYEQDKSIQLVKKIKQLFSEVSYSKEFLNLTNNSIFGNTPSLNIDDEDNHFAYLLIKLVVNAIESLLEEKNKTYNFDLLNESFGHFVRDNFRNHIEDAQYMTPTEAVDLICNIALNDLRIENSYQTCKEFIVCDPCCGVGSFLSSFYKKNKEQGGLIEPNVIKLVGQDKVARMARLAQINMLLFNNNNHLISNGNSLAGESYLDAYTGKVDLILTNPPFGAKFKSEELKPNATVNYPILNDLILNTESTFSSEILFIDKCISLLKPNGKLLAVLPDSVISSTGLNSTLRHRLTHSKDIRIKAVIELPAVTFAQAGTRTKTSILYLEKISQSSKKDKTVFIAQSENIGFEVSTKKGATVKIETGENDLIQILKSYENCNFSLNKGEQKVLNQSPSCVLVNFDIFAEKSSWTPSHYNAKKFQTVVGLRENKKQIELVRLNEIANFITRTRRKEFISKDSKCISILHILNHDNLNYEEMLTYQPKYPGIVCKEGDLLFSKINPRILRVLVVPELGLNLTCSSEFEIMASKIDINNYGIKLLLMLPSVQTQINYLTSGTSSSHNRIKSADLEQVLIPLPKKDSKFYDDLLKTSEEYEKRNKLINKLKLEMHKLKKDVANIVD